MLRPAISSSRCRCCLVMSPTRASSAAIDSSLLDCSCSVLRRLRSLLSRTSTLRSSCCSRSCRSVSNWRRERLAFSSSRSRGSRWRRHSSLASRVAVFFRVSASPRAPSRMRARLLARGGEPVSTAPAVDQPSGDEAEPQHGQGENPGPEDHDRRARGHQSSQPEVETPASCGATSSASRKMRPRDSVRRGCAPRGRPPRWRPRPGGAAARRSTRGRPTQPSGSACCRRTGPRASWRPRVRPPSGCGGPSPPPVRRRYTADPGWRP